MHYRDRFILFPAHDYSSPVQNFGEECWVVPRDLQVGSAVSSQRYVVNPYKLSGLVLSSLNLAYSLTFRSSSSGPRGLNWKSRLPAKHHHVGGHARAGLRRSPVTHQDERHELVPLLFSLSARCFQALSWRLETSFRWWHGVVLVLCIPNNRHTSSTTFDPKFVPWSLYNSRNAP